MNPAVQQLLQLLVNGIAVGFIYAIMAISVQLAYETTGVVNFATGQLVMIGAVVGAAFATISRLGTTEIYALTLACMVVIGLVFAATVYWPLQKRSVSTVVIATIAVGIVLQNVALMFFGPLPAKGFSPVGDGVLVFLGIVAPIHTLFAVIAALTLIGGLHLLLHRTPIGIQMRAIAQDIETARLMGIRTALVLAFTWSLTWVFAGVGGLLLAPLWLVDVDVGDSVALKAFAAAIIGGFGSIPGAIIGGLLVGLNETLSAAYISTRYKDVLVFGLMIAFLLFRPRGIFGERISERG
ncbi:MAG: branched-chain amino acid ABC transporter permease [Xanthobacteraceae bacterium]